MTNLRAFNLQQWIDDHRDRLRPPVGNQQMWEGTDMVLKVIDGGEFHDVPIREGEVFFLPAHVRHSPQRPVAGSIGLIIEPKRPDGLKDAFEWYCFDCGALVHRSEVLLKSIVRDLPPLYQRFFADETARTCPECGELHPGKVPPEGWVTL